MKAYLQFRIVHCNFLWKLHPKGKGGVGAYVPKWQWVANLLHWCQYDYT